MVDKGATHVASFPQGVVCLKKEILCLALSMKRGSLSWTGESVIFLDLPSCLFCLLSDSASTITTFSTGLSPI